MQLHLSNADLTQNLNSHFLVLKNDYLNKVHSSEINQKEINEKIKDINHDFLSKLTETDPLFIEVINKTIHKKGLTHFKFTDKVITDISKVHSKLKKQIDDKIEKWSYVKEKLEAATDEKVLYGWMAKAAYQSQVKEGSVIKTGAGYYKAVKVLKNDQGLRAVCFLPVNENGTIDENDKRPPVLSFRGTNPSNEKHLSDDLQSTIGMRSFLASKNEIGSVLNYLNDQCDKRCIVVGHSLGGALTQQAVAEFAGDNVIEAAYFYNSPGVGMGIVNKYVQNTESLETKPKLFDIHHHIDIVYRFGGAHLPADEMLVLDTQSKISKLAAHKLNNLIEGLENLGDHFKLNNYTERRNSLRNRVKHFVLEAGRTITSPFLRGMIKVVSAIKTVLPSIRRFFSDWRSGQVDTLHAGLTATK
ncbi:MAG: hypothetical protein H0V82_10800 [Candidatus Protochlamydia sp.]|nr:hypothetical protein [Candidatus Protochlamydia sp.]